MDMRFPSVWRRVWTGYQRGIAPGCKLFEFLKGPANCVINPRVLSFSEKVGERVDADSGEARREEAEVYRGEWRVPQGTQKGTVKPAL